MEMLCTKSGCGGKTRIIESKKLEARLHRRRHECKKCRHRFWTNEKPLAAAPTLYMGTSTAKT
jgi:transcriptional regulator NrdR family protein